ncbi:hypothetical protein BL253_37875 [Pseudofrankia asymbiotica]|uniref:Uncharacterized protein n=1 Tax=Pseudofrankia asymbiotica TaxID=1834516 RepID=A0A1V2HYU0_9ACTN|nr:hypothetical protein BL253_37875 [Pseudofrankia asymbiotica]
MAERKPVSGVGGKEFGEEFLDPGTDVVADRADGLEGLAGGVVEFPVLVAGSGEDGAGVAAAMVMTTSEAARASGMRIFGVAAVMSMPASAIAATATGLIWSAVSDPAERTSIRPAARWVSQPAAIWERPALWTQTNRTEGFSGMGGSFRKSGRCRAVRRSHRCGNRGGGG